MPFSMFRVTHQGHHLRNRTDHEMFDLYYPTDSNASSASRNGTACCAGCFWPWVPIGALLFALCPACCGRGSFARPGRPTTCWATFAIRKSGPSALEVALTVAFFALMFWLLELRWQAVLVMYAVFFGQLVDPAIRGPCLFAAGRGRGGLEPAALFLDVLGAAARGMGPQPPSPSGGVLVLSADSFCRRAKNGPATCGNTGGMWLGPRPATEPAPESLQQLPLSIHNQSE